MAKGKAGSSSQIATIAVYVFLLGALGTYFLPILGVTLPAFGKKSWSVQDVVKSIPKGVSQKGEEKGQFSPQFDFLDLVKEISPKNPETKAPSKVSLEFILGALVPVALALTYVFALLSLLLAPLKKRAVLFLTSALAAGCSAYTLLGVFYLSNSAQRAFSSSLEKVKDSPFAVITKNFVQEITIQPELGLYALVALTVLALGAGFYGKTAK